MTRRGTARILALAGFSTAALCATGAAAANPIITHLRTADPSAHVWKDGKVWLYTSHDMDDATSYDRMDGYHVFSSCDLEKWTDHGEILHSKNVSWAVGGSMYAPAAAYKNGVYYLYFPTMSKEWKWRVGVATSTKPEGPFTDIGRYIAGTDHIAPACFIDDDGTAYLYWGGDQKSPKVAKLKENMTELAETPRIVDYGSDNFGEGSYLHKRGEVYYFSYTGGGAKGLYSTGSSPYGPFTYRGAIGNYHPGAQDHHSMVEYLGQWYYFYHVGNYNNGTMYRRNVAVDYLFYNPDGTIQPVVGTTAGVRPVPQGCTGSGGQGSGGASGTGGVASGGTASGGTGGSKTGGSTATGGGGASTGGARTGGSTATGGGGASGGAKIGGTSATGGGSTGGAKSGGTSASGGGAKSGGSGGFTGGASSGGNAATGGVSFGGSGGSTGGASSGGNTAGGGVNSGGSGGSTAGVDTGGGTTNGGSSAAGTGTGGGPNGSEKSSDTAAESDCSCRTERTPSSPAAPTLLAMSLLLFRLRRHPRRVNADGAEKRKTGS